MSDLKSKSISDFNFKQYQELRQNLIAATNEERQMERYVLLACGIFYSWLASQSVAEKAFVVFASLLPPVIVFLATIRAIALSNGIKATADYLRKLEGQIYGEAPASYSGPRGWESFIHTNPDYGYAAKFERSQRVFWVLLLVLTTLAALAFLYLKK